jgi:hypothetical protein
MGSIPVSYGEHIGTTHLPRRARAIFSLRLYYLILSDLLMIRLA